MSKRQDWLELAEQYLEAAHILRFAKGPSLVAPIALLTWPATENSFKALAVGHTIPKTHDIKTIVAHLRRSSQLTQSELDSLSRPLLWVTTQTSYNASRYPEYGPKFWKRRDQYQYRMRIILMPVQGAREILTFVKQKLSD